MCRKEMGKCCHMIKILIFIMRFNHAEMKPQEDMTILDYLMNRISLTKVPLELEPWEYPANQTGSLGDFPMNWMIFRKLGMRAQDAVIPCFMNIQQKFCSVKGSAMSEKKLGRSFYPVGISITSLGNKWQIDGNLITHRGMGHFIRTTKGLSPSYFCSGRC